jgi:hypothetical protein
MPVVTAHFWTTTSVLCASDLPILYKQFYLKQMLMGGRDARTTQPRRRAIFCFCALRRDKLFKTRFTELPALLEERASTPQKRDSKTKGDFFEKRVLTKQNTRERESH